MGGIIKAYVAGKACIRWTGGSVSGQKVVFALSEVYMPMHYFLLMFAPELIGGVCAYDIVYIEDVVYSLWGL